MKSAVFSFSTDAKLMPKHRNLCLRNGIFYFRQMVGGKRIYKSLKTDDPYLARHLLNRILLSRSSPFSHTLSLNNSRFAMFNVDFCKINTLPFDEKNVVLKSSKKTHKLKEENMNPNTNATNATVIINGHKIMDIWNNVVKHNFGRANDLKTATERLQRAVDCLGVETIEKLFEEPALLDNMYSGLACYVIPNGRYAGCCLSKGTIKDTVGYLKQVIDVSVLNKWVTEDMCVSKRLALKKYVYANWNFCAKKERVALSEQELKQLFVALRKLKDRDFDLIDEAIAKKRGDVLLLRDIKNNPDIIFYVTLLALFTGARANAVSTLRHKDIDIRNKTVSFGIDEKLVKNGDVREKCKRLKNQDATRVLPVAQIIEELGFFVFLSAQRVKNGVDAFIFEDAVANKNGIGYRIPNISEAVNEFLKILGFKANVGGGELLDMHSFKKSFYTYNSSGSNNFPRNLLEIFGGNKPSVNAISVQHYIKPRHERTPSIFENIANRITFPYIEFLFGGVLPQHLSHLDYFAGKTNATTGVNSVVGSKKDEDASKDNQFIFDMLGFRLPDDYKQETENALDYADSISDDADVVRATIAQKYKNLSDSELISRLFRCDEIFTSCTGENKTIWHTPMATARLASIEWGKLYIAYNERYKKNPHIYDLYERACDTINPSRFESRHHSPIQ